MAKIRFEKARKEFKDVSVIKWIDLTINDGEFFTFVWVPAAVVNLQS